MDGERERGADKERQATWLAECKAKGSCIRDGRQAGRQEGKHADSLCRRQLTTLPLTVKRKKERNDTEAQTNRRTDGRPTTLQEEEEKGSRRRPPNGAWRVLLLL